MKNRDRPQKVALLAAPWPLYNRPSIQLATLKAYLRQALPDLTVDAFHLHLAVAAAAGYRRYAAISERTWLAEPVFAARLYPERADRARALFCREARRYPDTPKIDFTKLVNSAGDAVDRFIAGVDWEAYLAVGFTISLCQLTASLYLALKIKERCPGLHIVAGGSSVAGETGRALLSAFGCIDSVIQGEGEKPLTGLIARLRAVPGRGPSLSPAILTGRPGAAAVKKHFDQMPDLDTLPVPDFDDYFDLLGRLAPEKRFFPVLPVEMSRGCWWQKRPGRGGRGCAFCNLNTQWHGYRAKTPARVGFEIESLRKKHQLLNYAFMDNALPVPAARDLFSALAGAGHDFSFFGEIRASTDYRTLVAMHRAGVTRVQIGIEALSTGLLKKLNKGTTAITNLEIMKHCEELGIESRSNLIVQFPGSDQADVDATLQTIAFAAVYRPLKPVRFWLGRGSPVCGDPAAFGIQSHFNHPYYRSLFPQDICNRVPLLIQAYRGDRVKQRQLWKPVMERLKQWEKAYTACRRQDPAVPILGYQDGGEFLIIRQKEAAGPPRSHRLTGSSRRIYLYCRRQRALAAIVKRHPGFSRRQVKVFLDDMVRKKLMFTENGRYLSLAVRTAVRSGRGPEGTL